MQLSLPISGKGFSVTELRRTVAGRAALVFAASVFVAVCAHLSVPLWFTPVPLSLGNFAVLLVGLALGPVDGFAALALYLAEGASGLPVFTPQGPGGVAQLMGPTGGFLLAYPLVAAVAGAISRVVARRIGEFGGAVLACAAATAVLFAIGAGWLGHVLHLSAAAAAGMGVAPFVPGELVKIAAAAGISTSSRRLLAGTK